MLKPINAEIDFEYKCEKCGGSNWITKQETISRKLKCYCGHINTVIPIKYVKITYNCFNNQKILNKQSVQKAINILRGVGYLKSTAETMVLKIAQTNSSLTTDKLVKQAIKEEVK